MIEGEIVEKMSALTLNPTEIGRKVLLVSSLLCVRSSQLRSCNDKQREQRKGVGSTLIRISGPSSFSRSLVDIRAGGVGIAINL